MYYSTTHHIMDTTNYFNCEFVSIEQWNVTVKMPKRKAGKAYNSDAETVWKTGIKMGLK